MKKITTLLMLAIMTTFGWQANSQNGGNTCAEAVTAGPGTYSDVAIIAGTGGAAQASAADAMWYSYTPATDGLLSISSCATDPAGIDTRLYIYTDGCDTLTLYGVDDDGCDAPTTYGSILADVAVVAQQEYLIEWDDRWGNAEFDWVLTGPDAYVPPTGLTCADAFVATPGVYSDAAITPGSGSATQTGGTDALWYSYTAEGNGTIGISSCASDPAGIDTRLYVYTDGCDTLTLVDNDDDGCDAPTTYGSIVSDVAVNEGQVYLIQWDDRWGAAAFDWELTFTPAPLDPTVLPITLENQLPTFGDFNGSFTQAIANPDASGANTSATVAENTVPANAGFAGVNFGLDANIDISVQKGFTMTVWSPVANTPVLLKLENGSGANAEVLATTTTTGAWETISFDFSAVGQLTYESVTLFMNFNVIDPATQTYYWDNLEQVDVLITGGAQIVEIDADQTGTDDQEFVEIKTEFANQSLNGMIAVFYNGSSDTSYRTVDLTGFASDDNGYFLLGSDAVAGADITMGADNTIQNGADAVALHTADAANFPDGTPATDAGLVDAVVYGTSDADDTGLLTGLGQTIQWDENENGAKDTESLQWDDATQGFCAGVPTPKAVNTPCPVLSDGLGCATALVAVPGVYNDVAITVGSGSASQVGGTDALWYVYTAEADGSININSCISDPAAIDTRLWVHTDGCDTLTAVAGDDDGCDAPNGFGSVVTDVIVNAGQEYLIEWDDRWGAAQFDWELTFTPAPVVELPINFELGQAPIFGDFNASNTQIIANPDATGANTSATVAQNTVPANAGFAGANFPLNTNIDISVQRGFNMSVWSPVDNTPVLLKLENASGANAEILATTTTTGAWETISFDFSEVGQLTYESVTIFMNFNVVDPATQTYYWDNLEQFVVLNGNSCAEALVAVPGVYNDVAITVGSGSASQDGGTDALWYVYTAQADGSININSCISDPAAIDTRLWVHTDGCDTLTAVAGDDDGCDAPNGFGSIVTDIAVVGGQEYLIEWDDRWGADQFDWELTFTPAPGSSCATALVAVPGVYNDVAISVGNGSASQDDGTDALWYVYTAEADGSININSCISDPAAIDTRLWVYTDGCDTLTAVAGDDDGCDAPNGFGSVVTDVAVVGGQEYLIEWDDRWGADQFDWELTFTPVAAPVVELPITFEDGQLPVFNDFNGSATQVIANPDASGANDSATVAENVVPANAGFAGVNFAVENLDISTLKGFTMTVWSAVANTPVLLKLENATTGVNAERAATTTTTGAWETISFDFSAEGDLTFESVTVFMNFNVVDPADQTYYWDNLVQGEPLDVTQNDLVDITMYPNPATSVVTLDASQEIATIQIMNLLGQNVSTIEVNNTSSTINVSQFSTGVYIANVLFSNGNVQTIKFIKE